MKKPLIVFAPNISGDPKCFDQLKVLLKDKTQFKDFFSIDFEFKRPIWSNADLESLSEELLRWIDDDMYLKNDEISEILLVGHSLGTTLLRRAFLNASGFGFHNGTEKPWVKKVSRIIMMGAISKGIKINNLPIIERLGYKCGLFVLSILGQGKMVKSILNGSSFLSKLRIDWIKYNRNVKNQPILVHLLGNNDRIVSPNDVIDIEQFPNAIPLKIPHVGHRNIIFPDLNTSTTLIRAFSENFNKNPYTNLDTECKKVFFFIHGIRDSRKCFKDISNILEQLEPGSCIVEPQYGYLSALDFLNTRYRNSLVNWFIDEYADNSAFYPNAEFYIAGHSNGTYILGEALKRIPNMSFSRIYLAASVLPPDFQWDDIVQTYNQTNFVRSDMGTEDWPVSVMCRVLNKFGIKSIGPGGADGFEWHNNQYISYNKFIGGHSAMLNEINRQSITNYLMLGTSKKNDEVIEYQESTIYNLFKKFGDIIIPIFLVSILSLLVYLALRIGYPCNLYLLFIPAIIVLILDRF